jgi:hypothetical protein
MSSLSSFPLPSASDYGLVVAAGAFSGLALVITASLAGAKRKEAGVKLPNLYASDKTAAEDPKVSVSFPFLRFFLKRLFSSRPWPSTVPNAAP